MGEEEIDDVQLIVPLIIILIEVSTVGVELSGSGSVIIESSVCSVVVGSAVVEGAGAVSFVFLLTLLVRSSFRGMVVVSLDSTERKERSLSAKEAVSALSDQSRSLLTASSGIR